MNAAPQTAKEIFVELIGKVPPADWDEMLNQACGTDDELRQRVRKLLHAHRDPDSFLETPPSAVAVEAGLTIDQSPPPERPGTQIGPYKLLQQIGEGGMGVVYMAEQTEPVQRKVALKVIKPGMDSRQVIARFEAERQALAMMDHVNIARVLDAGATETGRPYFVMELVHGVPITKYCDDNRLTLRQRLELFMPVCQAIQHAHQKGIIHRDIKPSNVMVTLYDGKPVPKVIDFGVAKATEQKLTERTLFTQYGTMVGTLEYMSPEQAEMSALGVDTRSDIYSLGVLLYELLTGSTPLSSKRMKEAAYAEILRLIKEEEPPKPSTRLSDSGEALASISAQRHTEPAKLSKLLRGELDWIVMKTLEKDRNRRYETANGFAQDLQRYLDDEPVQAGPPSAAYRFRKFTRRNKAALLTAAAVAAALLVGTTMSAWQAIRATRAEGIAQLRLKAETAARVAAASAQTEARIQEMAAIKHQGRAESHERLALRNLYSAQIGLAGSARLAGDPSTELRILEGQRPAPGEEDLRGFEWYYLWRQCHAGHLLTLRNNGKPLTCVAFSIDGKALATAGADGTIKILDMPSGRLRVTLSNHQEELLWVAYSPDGRLLASIGALGTVTLWDMSTERVQRTWRDVSARLHGRCLCFAPDGQTLAISSARDGVKLWNTANGSVRLRFKGDDEQVLAVAFSPDGNSVATAGASKGLIEIWDVATGSKRSHLSANAAVWDLAFSSDGKLLATGKYWRDFVDLWDTTAWQRSATLQGHKCPVRAVQFFPNGNQLATGTLDGNVLIWDVNRAAPVRTYGHSNSVSSLSISPDGSLLAVADRVGCVKVWDVQTAVSDKIHKEHSSAVRSVVFSPDGGTVATAGGQDGTVKLWDVVTERVRTTVSTGLKSVVAVCISPDGKLLAMGGDGATIALCDVATGQHRDPLHAPEGAYCLQFSPDGKFLAAGSTLGGGQLAKLWHVDDGSEYHSLVTGPQTVVAFSRDGGVLAAVGWDGLVRLLDVASRRVRFSFPTYVPGGHAMPVFCMAFSPDGRMLATGSRDQSVVIWDLASGQPAGILSGHNGDLTGVCYLQEGRILATCSQDGTVKFWDLLTMKERGCLAEKDHSVWSMDFSPDRGTMVTGGWDGDVRFWAAASEQEVLVQSDVVSVPTETRPREPGAQ